MRFAISIGAMLLLTACFCSKKQVPTPEDVAAALNSVGLGGENPEVVRRQLRMAEQAKDMSKAGGLTILVGVLAFVFGHLARIPRWVGVATVAIGVLVSVFGYQLLEFLGTDISKIIMGVSFGMLAIGASAAALWYIYDWVRDHV